MAGGRARQARHVDVGHLDAELERHHACAAHRGMWPRKDALAPVRCGRGQWRRVGVAQTDEGRVRVDALLHGRGDRAEVALLHLAEENERARHGRAIVTDDLEVHG